MSAFAPNGDGGISWAKNKTWLQMVLIVTAQSPKQFDSGTFRRFNKAANPTYVFCGPSLIIPIVGAGHAREQNE